MNPQTAARPRWSMVLSHHPPSQYDRTLHIGRVRICARCAGLLAGIVSAIALMPHLPVSRISSSIALFAAIAFVLSLGIASFVLNEVGSRASNNYERLLFGFVLGCLLYLAYISGFWSFFAMLALVVAGQFATALLLRRLCVLDRFVNEYIEGAMDRSPTGNKSQVRCGQFFCTCSGSTPRLRAAEVNQHNISINERGN